MSGAARPSAPLALRFWIGEPPDLIERSAAEILAALERQELSLSTPLRVSPDAAPTPLARYLRELVWMERRDHAVPEREVSLFQAAFEHAPVGIVIADLAGRIVQANKAFADLLDHRPEALAGVPIGQISHEASRAEELALGNEMMSGLRSSFQVEKAFLSRGGDRVDTLTDVALMQDAGGHPTAVVGHVLDLRTRKALEGLVAEHTRARLESEERFERLFVHAPQAMIMADAAGRVVNANRAAGALFGYEAAEWDGLPLSALIPVELREAHDRHFADHARDAPAARMALGREVSAVRKDGARLVVEIGLVPVTVGGARLTLAGISDVTEARRNRDALERSLHEKETLLREIHHRVKNNLQIVSSLLAMQAEHVPAGPASAALSDSVSRVRSMALVHQLLYSLDSLARVDLGRYVEELARSLSRAYRPDARISVEAEPLAVSMENAIPLGLILNELLSNALKYAFPPTHDLRGTDEEGWDLRVQVRPGEIGVVVGVDDHGPGLSTSAAEGAGSLGMTLVRALVRQLRGRLVVRADRGARIEVHCPLG